MNKQFCVSLCVVAALLSGCTSEKENPLINDEDINYIRNYTYNGYSVFTDKNFDKDCQGYLTGQEKPTSTLKVRCDKGVQAIFTTLLNAAQIGANASLEQKHDPKLWQRVFNTQAKSRV